MRRRAQQVLSLIARLPRRFAVLAGLALAFWAITAVEALVGGGTGDDEVVVSQEERQGGGDAAPDGAARTGLDPVGAVTRAIAAAEPEALDPPVRGPAAPRSVRDLAERLPPSRQVAQLFLVDAQGSNLTSRFFSRLRRRDWGGVVLREDNYTDPAQLAAYTGEIRVIAEAARHVPPFVAAAQYGGPDAPFADLPPRPPFELAPLGSRAVERAYRTAAGQLRLLGVTLLLGPSADVTVQGGPAEEEAFADDAGAVASLVTAAVRGALAGGVVSAPQHFPGQGAASQDPLAGPASVGLSIDELRERDLVPFRRALRASGAVIVSNAVYAAWDGVTPAALAPEAYALLRRELGFGGVAIADDLEGAAAATGGTVPEAAVAALAAGADMLLVPGGAAEQEAAYRAVAAAVRTGEIPPERIRDAVLRVLDLKVESRILRPARSRRG